MLGGVWLEERTLNDWHDFFVAEVGASAALAGLLFVTISLNIRQILKYAHLPIRAAHTLAVLVGALLVASVALIPWPSSVGADVLGGMTLANWIVSAVFVRHYVRTATVHDPDSGYVPSIVYVRSFIIASQLATVPLAVGGLLALAGNPQALFWVAAGILTSFVTALQNTWILLVEILR